MMANKNKTERRLELLKVAREVFAEKGFEAATISEIVSRVGMAQGTFYLYFPSKVGLVLALAEEMQEQIKKAIREAYAQAQHPGEMIDRSVHAAFRTMEEHRDVLGVIHSGVCWTQAPQERERLFAPYYNLIAELIRHEQALGRVSPHVQPDITAVLVVGVVYYAADECFLYNTDARPEAYIAEAISFIRRALGTP
jgi:AcrR family transcriptional regulator